MTAQNVDTFVIGFSDPAIPNPDPIRSRVNVSQAFDLSINNVVTLSTNTANGNDDIAGLLYVPTLSPSDPCANASKQYVPNNVTRLENLPPTQYQYKYTAFAPWFSAECTKSYLAAIVPPNIITSFIFYQPSSNTDASPPGPSDPAWGLQDGGSWKKNNPFPVYAIPGSNGAFFMQQLAQYSGNTSQAPNSDLLSKEFSPTDYIRVFSTFTTASGTSLPTLWAFLLIVLGVVLVLVAITSFAMHFIQRRARRDLQRRLQNGEVPLEWLGIKAPRMTQEDIDALPLGPYVPNENKPTLPLNDNSDPTTATATPPKGNSAQQKGDTTQPPPAASATSPQDYNQPTCPICLEDYVPHSTRVRSLPCHHIYHPDCIDRYLLRTSSLCPICKTKVVPPSHGVGRVALPRINNTMVRRERYARRLAQRTDQPGGGGNGYGEPQSHVPFSGAGGFRRWVRRVPGVGFVGTALLAREPAPSTATTAGEGPQRGQQSTESQIEMGAIGSSSSRPNLTSSAAGATIVDSADPSSPTGATEQNTAAVPAPDAPPPADTESRREWARRRASALLGRHPGPNDNDDGAVADQITAAEPDEARRPGWRKAIGKAFPGFR